MTKEEVEQLVRETVNKELGFGEKGTVFFVGSPSYKTIGKCVGDALLHSPVVVVDARGVCAVAGKRPLWNKSAE